MIKTIKNKLKILIIYIIIYNIYEYTIKLMNGTKLNCSILFKKN